MRKTALILITSLIFSGCSTLKRGWSDMNLFPLSYDVDLGKQVDGDILSKPDEFPVLQESKNPEIYTYVNKVVQKILNTGKIKNRDNFKWEVKIIKDDKVLNAFATPGGYIYLYTGLILFLDSEDELAGVLGHEMAHADQRHSTKQLTKILGVQILLDVALNAASKNEQANQTVGQITTAIIGLKFSRTHESEADNYSVQYLCPTDYSADGSAGFFKKMLGKTTPPEWLSTHPSPKNRVEKITQAYQELACKGTRKYQKEYTELKKLIKEAKFLKPTNISSGQDKVTPRKVIIPKQK